MNKESLKKMFILIIIAATIAFVVVITWNLYEDLNGVHKFYNAPSSNYSNNNRTFTNIKMSDGVSIASLAVTNFDAEQHLCKVEIINDVNFTTNKSRTVIRYVFQKEDLTIKNEHEYDCDREYYCQEIITTSDGKKILKENSWKTKQCHESGTSPEIFNKPISTQGIDSLYQNAVHTVNDYFKTVFDHDSTFFLRSASFSVHSSDFSETWSLQLVNKSSSSILVNVDLSKEGNYIYSVMLDGSPDYLKMWSHLRFPHTH